MNRILSIDPGHTTGIAVYDENGVLELSMAIPAATIRKGGAFLSLIEFTVPKIALVEALPVNYVDNVTNEIWNRIVGTLQLYKPKLQVITIKPSQWKRFVERVEIPGQHARDAATMALWWIENREK